MSSRYQDSDIRSSQLVWDYLLRNRGEWVTAREIAQKTYSPESTVYNTVDEILELGVLSTRGSQPVELQLPSHAASGENFEFEVGDKFENTHQDEVYMVVGRQYHLDEERPDHHDTYFTDEEYRRHYQLGTAESLGGDTFAISERDLLSHPEIVSKTGDDDE